jgi:carbon monoxide dehydrogenase subunit G
MKIEGTFMVPAPRQTVWEHLLNPETLAKSLPGCEKLESQSDGSYHAEMKVGIAAVKGNYRGRVEILEPVPHEHFRMKVEGKGTGGFLKGEGLLTLIGNGNETLVGYTGDAQVGGVIASVGQRLVQAAARQIVQQFFQAFSKQLA